VPILKRTELLNVDDVVLLDEVETKNGEQRLLQPHDNHSYKDKLPVNWN
jgi:hypothetical protein